MLAACEKLYRKNFPNFISIKNLFNPKGYTSKRYSNNYTVGIVFACCTFAFIPIFYFAIQNYNKVIDNDRNHWRARFNLCVISIKQKKFI